MTCQASVSDNFRAFSLNLGGGFEGKLEEVVSVVKDDRYDFCALQELWTIGDIPSLRVREYLNSHNLRIFMHASSTNKARNVAILIRADWRVTAVLKDGSGSAVAVKIRLPSNEHLLVASVLMPTGLDEGGGAKRVEARRITGQLRVWCDRHPYWLFMGDFNETRCSEDRHRTGYKTSIAGDRTLKRNCLNAFIAGSGGVDTFRHLHPDDPGFTRERHGSKARLDYALCARQLVDSTVVVNCCVKRDLLYSDHAAIHFQVSGPNSGKAFVLPTPRLPYHPTNIRVLDPNTHPGKAHRCRTQVDLALEKISTWMRRMLEDKQTQTPADAKTRSYRLCMVIQEFTKVVRDSAVSVYGVTRPLNKNKKHSPEMDRNLSSIRWIGAMKASILVRYCGSDRNNVANRKKIARNLTELGIAHPDIDDSQACLDWLPVAGSLISHYRRQKLALVESDPSSSLDPAERLFYRSKTRRKFYDAVFRSNQSAVLDSAVDPLSGELVSDPSKYLPLVSNKVGTQFAKKLSAPRKDRDGLLPKWWGRFYGRDHKNIPNSAFANVIGKVKPSEVIESIEKTSSGIAPGWDSISIDLLKVLAIRPAPGHSVSTFVDLLTLIINAGFVCKEIPKPLKHGVIVMIPKGGSDIAQSDVDNMRPITLLPEFGKIASRIIAMRIGDVFQRCPQYLEEAQRAFLRNGSVDHCVDLLL
ncbi:MAG: hypothetical protein JWR85_3684, partial [Marmoricola sp.]|nr:hypothetical protein [Marmoricola sp.]